MDYGTSISLTSASAGIAIASPSIGLAMVLYVILIVAFAALLIRRGFRAGVPAIAPTPMVIPFHEVEEGS